MLTKCYVCHKKLGFGKVILNPKVEAKWWKGPERYICLNTTSKPRPCYSILHELATWGQCSSGCCSAYHMNKFDLDKHIEEIKNGRYIYKYTDYAVSLLKKVGRI